MRKLSTTEISKQKQPEGLEENKDTARKGGGVAKKARVEIEKQSGQAVVNSNSAKKLLKGSNND